MSIDAALENKELGDALYKAIARRGAAYHGRTFENTETIKDQLSDLQNRMLPRALLENLALHFGVENPDALPAELGKCLKAKAAEHKDLKARFESLAKAERFGARSTSMVCDMAVTVRRARLRCGLKIGI